MTECIGVLGHRSSSRCPRSRALVQSLTSSSPIRKRSFFPDLEKTHKCVDFYFKKLDRVKKNLRWCMLGSQRGPTPWNLKLNRAVVLAFRGNFPRSTRHYNKLKM